MTNTGTTLDRDLFGELNKSPEPAPIASGKRRKTVPKGYAAPPGTGPKGETCRSCVHYCIRKLGKSYRKCGLARERWTGGAGTDIKASAPACRYWNGGIGTAYVCYDGEHKPTPQKTLIVSTTDAEVETTFGTFVRAASGRWEWSLAPTVYLERIVKKEGV